MFFGCSSNVLRRWRTRRSRQHKFIPAKKWRHIHRLLLRNRINVVIELHSDSWSSKLFFFYCIRSALNEPNWSCLQRTDSPSTMESNFITQSPSRSAEPSIQANAFHRLGDQFLCSATSYPRDQQHAPWSTASSDIDSACGFQNEEIFCSDKSLIGVFKLRRSLLGWCLRLMVESLKVVDIQLFSLLSYKNNIYNKRWVIKKFTFSLPSLASPFLSSHI